MMQRPLPDCAGQAAKGHRREPRLRVLVVAQTPPPIHGQSVMTQSFLSGNYRHLELHRVRMAFSGEIQDVGRFRCRKILHVISVFIAVLVARWKTGARILYYPPAGPNHFPIVRDIFLLALLRPIFRGTVFHFHASGLHEFLRTAPSLLAALMKRAYGRPDLAICMGESGKADAEVLQAGRVSIVPYGLEDLATAPAHPGRIHRGSGSVKLLFVGMVCEEKGVGDLLRACAILDQRGIRYALEIAGSFRSSSEKAELESLARKLVKPPMFHGQVDGWRKVEVFEGADVFCFPSYYSSEGFPVVLLEAMVFSLPVVATRWRSIPDIVQHGTTGLLTEIREPALLADALQSLIENAGLRARLAANSREVYEQRYTLQQYRAGLESAFMEAFPRGRA